MLSFPTPARARSYILIRTVRIGMVRPTRSRGWSAWWHDVEQALIAREQPLVTPRHSQARLRSTAPA